MTVHIGSFLFAVSLMLVHELDAMQRHEWRMLPGLSRLSERTGMLAFVWMHVPLFVAIIWYSAKSIGASGDLFSYCFSVFCIVHAFVHMGFEMHPNCEFKNTLSRSIIWSSAGFGLIAVFSA